jgi:hypothetical protein
VSHRWQEGEEVSYEEFLAGAHKHKPGWRKIKEACSIAQARGIDLVWIDTCCIDKRSSSELSAAINSMFEWYRGAKECYAFLSDVEGSADDPAHGFSRSVWFERGWTLQELLAPWSVYFYNKHYQSCGTKTSLAKLITESFGIEARFLDPWQDVRDASVAQRMSWAAGRETKEPEDMAYSLLGIFGVNMPLIYGEGDRAFLRLQLEIIKQIDDESIFAWPQDSDDEIHDDESCGMLALHPRAFKDCGFVFPTRTKGHHPYNFTSRGLKLQVPRQWSHDESHYKPVCFRDTEIIVDLDCEEQHVKTEQLAIVLRRSRRTGLWYRRACVKQNLSSGFLSRFCGISTVYIPQPELGQVIAPVPEEDRRAQSTMATLTWRLIFRWLSICFGLIVCSCLQTFPRSSEFPIAAAAAGMVTWSFWTILWVGMGSNSSLLLEMLAFGLLTLVVFSFPGLLHADDSKLGPEAVLKQLQFI